MAWVVFFFSTSEDPFACNEDTHHAKPEELRAAQTWFEPIPLSPSSCAHQPPLDDTRTIIRRFVHTNACVQVCVCANERERDSLCVCVWICECGKCVCERVWQVCDYERVYMWVCTSVCERESVCVFVRESVCECIRARRCLRHLRSVVRLRLTGASVR